MVINPQELKRRRIMLDLTQKMLSNKLDLSQSIISKFESRKHYPGYHTLTKIEEGLKKLEKLKEKNKTQSTVEEIMNKNIVSFKKTDKVKEVIKMFKKKGISQAPVIENNQAIGLITAKSLLDAESEKIIEFYLESEPPMISNETTVNTAKTLLKQFPVVLINKKGKISGLITREDVL